jgi:hypothetical protein
VEDLALDLYALVRSRPRKLHTVQQALADHRWITDFSGALGPLALWQYIQLWVCLRGVQLTEVLDELVWRWLCDPHPDPCANKLRR